MIDLAAMKERAYQVWPGARGLNITGALDFFERDVPALFAEVERLREEAEPFGQIPAARAAGKEAK